MNLKLQWTAVLVPLAFWAIGYTQAGAICECYNQKECADNSNYTNSSSVVECKNDQFCFATWRNVSGKSVEVINKGCWLQNSSCSQTCLGNRQAEKLVGPDAYFCCCSNANCNSKLKVAPVKPTNVTVSTASPSALFTHSPSETKHERVLQILSYYVMPVLAFIMVVLFVFCLYTRHKGPFLAVTVEEELIEPPASPAPCYRPIQLVEAVAQGHFGTVWKASLLKDTVAVKILAMQERAAWSNEQELYSFLRHENILLFITAEKHTDEENYTEYWLVSEYHDYGSLADYLKRHTISWPQLCNMAYTTANGLAYLHSEISGEKYKPCIAHRDLKSKNVLVKSDLSCCLGDFGLAMRFETGTNPGDMHGQVGTRRYMAPEVLEGAITFSRESFLRVDVYALALILWEMSGRCTAADGPVEEYKVPFEDEVGLHPALEDMQQVVVQKKLRPTLRQEWFVHPGMENLMQTIDECWDQEADARLTAQCVAERMHQAMCVPTTTSEQTALLSGTTVKNNMQKSTTSMESTI